MLKPWITDKRKDIFVGDSCKAQCIDFDLFEDKDNLKEFSCTNGLGILSLINAKIDNCNHMYCGKCCKDLLYCPATKQPITQFQDIPIILKSFLGRQRMKCSAYQKGCKWRGQYKDYSNHIQQECQICPQKQCAICNEMIEKQYFKQHLQDNAIQHYKIQKKQKKEKFDDFIGTLKTQNLQSPPDINLSIFYQAVKISLHEHLLQFTGSRENFWFCDSVKDAPIKRCLSGHQNNEYHWHRNEATLMFSCTQAGCNHAYCYLCVRQYLISLQEKNLFC